MTGLDPRDRPEAEGTRGDRRGPRESVRAGLAALLVGALITGAGLVWAQDLEEAEGELESLEGEIQSGEERREALERREASLRAELAETKRRLVALGERVQSLEERLRELEARRNALAEQEQELLDALGSNEARVIELLSALQVLGRTPHEALVTRHWAPLETARGAALLQSSLPAVESRAETLSGRVEELVNVRRALEQRRQELATAREDLARERSALRQLVDRRSEMLAQTRSAQEDTQARLQRLAEQAEDLRSLIDRIEAERRKRTIDLVQRVEAARVARERAASEAEARDRAAAEAAEEAARARAQQASLPPAQNQGPQQLRVPVSGQMVTRYGEEGEFGTVSRGVRYATVDGAQVVAPLSGQVAFVGPFEGYGEIVIIENGSGYTTLLAGMSEVFVEFGANLLNGEPVGVVDDGSTERPTLYLELRRNGRPVNPLPGLAVTSTQSQG